VPNAVPDEAVGPAIDIFLLSLVDLLDNT